MNWNTIEANWKQVSVRARERFGRLTESDWQMVAGRRDQLVGRIQERYGIAQDEAARQADEWSRTLTEEKTTTARTGSAGSAGSGGRGV
jgi:uncharacterized protein YjbJ (UPF0337 family)